MTDGTNPPSNPQPEPAPGSGGYGFPPGPAASGGYGFPPGQSGPPAPGGGYGFPQGGGYGYPPNQPAGGGFGPPPAFPQGPGLPGPDQGLPVMPSGDQPDWEAMADRSAAERRKKRLWMIGGAVTVLLLLAGGGTFLLMKGDKPAHDDTKDVADNPPASSAPASPDPNASASKSYSPTVASDPSLLRDSVGKTSIRMGPEATVPKVGEHYELRLKGNPNSYAQATEAAVDTTKSFSLSARVNSSSAAKGAQMAMSQGTGESFSFELGADDVNGKQAWVFRVRTNEKSPKPTIVTIAAEGLKTVKTTTVLTAVHDAEKKMISLYVEGKKAGEAQIPGIWQNAGPLQLGRARHDNQWVGAWQGSMTYIRFYGMAFSPEQAAAYRKGELDDAAKATATHSWVVG
ncbi:LamG-like jellyroll fold domain-containing protein [Streptomyces sp. NPDC059989]|uniref:LamG-like jellyroll fold domain-containing protein n=1 Tax=Streptomyces sp. NPDC059989 TaxID=3347026 RepID=UPI003683F83A